MKEKMPAVNVDMLDGSLAWRQHDGGHTDGPNVEHFIRWANSQWRDVPVVVLTAKDLNEADRRALSGRVEEVIAKGAQSQQEVLGFVHKLLAERGSIAA